MSNYNYSNDSDDDLFDYDPELEDNLKFTINQSSESFNSEDNIINKIDGSLDDIESFVNEKGNVVGNKAALALAFHETVQHFIYSSLPEGELKSIKITLDNLTDGRYSLMNMFYRLEIKISKRMHFLSIFERVFNDHTLPEFMVKTFKDVFKLEMTSFHIKTCYISSLAICNHALVIDRAMYKHLSNKLGIPVKQELFDPPTQMTQEDHKVDIHSYNEVVTSNIYKAMSQDGLLDQLNEDFSMNSIKFVVPHEE